MSKLIKAICFPGQGSQYLGMGKKIYEDESKARDRFDQASDVLNRDLRHICFESDEEILKETRNAQICLFLIAYILYELFFEDEPVKYFLGHSLGELTAYCASGVLSFEHALRLIDYRAKAMSEATKKYEGGMVAIMKLPLLEIENLVALHSDDNLVIANYNSPGQVVISGEKKVLERVCNDIRDRKGRVISLPVSGAFHSPLMNEVSEQLKLYVDEFEWHSPSIPIILNRLGRPLSDIESLKENVYKQVISSVRWVSSVLYLEEKVDVLLECGPGRVLSGLNRKISSKLIIESFEG